MLGLPYNMVADSIYWKMPVLKVWISAFGVCRNGARCFVVIIFSSIWAEDTVEAADKSWDQKRESWWVCSELYIWGTLFSSSPYTVIAFKASVSGERCAKNIRKASAISLYFIGGMQRGGRRSRPATKLNTRSARRHSRKRNQVDYHANLK